MSLRKKIILLFLGLAVVPLLILAAFSYWQAQNLLRSNMQAQLQEAAIAFGRELGGKKDEVERDLNSLSRSLQASEPPAIQDALGEDQSDSSSVLESAVLLEFRSNTGRIHVFEGSKPLNPIRCQDQAGSRFLELSVEAVQAGTPGLLVAGFWASDLVASLSRPHAYSVHVVDPVTSEALFSDNCEILQDGTRSGWTGSFNPIRLGSESAGTFRYKGEMGTQLGAFTDVPGLGWRVIITSPPTTIASDLDRMVLAYWVFVLGLALTTGVAFSMLLGKFTQSLQELARAAEEIGTGELDPWLPLPTSGEVGQLTLAFSRMLSRIRQMMAKVDQSGRLAVVGQLSAYLAHEIRNPLSSIKLNLQRLQRWTNNGTLPEFCLEPLEISLKEVERLSASVTGVLELSSAPNSPLEVASLHSLVGEAADLLAGRFRRQGVELTLDMDAEADRVLARIGQLKGVILNLMVNALESQPEGGRLNIRSGLSRSSELGGLVVSLHFKDEGQGVLPEVRDRIFEPFFSTKVGGSGIGLAMASQAVQDSMGDLYLEPSLTAESGAEFVVVLPLAAVEAAVAGGIGSDREPWVGVPPHWRRPSDTKLPDVNAGKQQPSHLMSPEGLKAVLAFAREDPEDLN